jgi:hypothetical protein
VVCNTQHITNIYSNCVSYIPHNIASLDSMCILHSPQHSFVRFDDTKSQLIFSFARPLSSAWFVKLHNSTELTCDSKVRQCWHNKKHLRLTLLACMRIQTCAPFMQNVSPSCPRICSWRAPSGVKDIKRYVKIYLM